MDDPFQQLNQPGRGGPPSLDQSSIDRLFNSTESAFKAAEPYAKQAMEKNQAAANELRQSSGEAYKIASEPTPKPALPKLKDMPEPPDTSLKDPTQAFGSVLSIMALLSSLATRAPLKSAMRAMTGVINGARQGQKDIADYQTKRFQAAMEEARGQNDKELSEYQAELSNAKLSVDEKLARLHALAIKHEDQAAAHQLETKGIEGFRDFLLERAKMSQSLLAHQIQWEWQRDLAMWRSSPGRLTAEQYHKNEQIMLSRQKVDELLKDEKSKKLIEELKAKPTMAVTNADKAILQILKDANTKLYGVDDEYPGTTFKSSDVYPAEEPSMFSRLFGGGGESKLEPGKPTGKAEGSLGGATSGSPEQQQTIQFAKSAISRGVPRELVKQRWVQIGGDPAQFDQLVK